MSEASNAGLDVNPPLKNLQQRLLAVMTEVDYIKKDKRVDGAGGGYMAVTHDKVASEVRPWLIKFGVLVKPSLVPGTAQTVQTGRSTKAGSPIIRLEAEYEVSFINVDQPSDRETMRVVAHAEDQGDKAPGKALSYAQKSAVLKMFSIETGEDDEGRNVEDGMSPDRVDGLEAQIKAATDGEQLRGLVTGADAEAREANDSWAQKRLIAAGRARAEQLGIKPDPKVALPQSNSGAKAEEPKKSIEPKAGEKASVGLIKSVRNLARLKGMSDGQILQLVEAEGHGLFKSIDEITKEVGGVLLKKIGETADV